MNYRLVSVSLFLVSTFALIMPFSSFAEGPCKEKWEAKHQAHKALHECIMTWARDVQLDAPDPSGDCSSQLSAFIQAAKDVKACRTQHKKDANKKQ